MPCEWASQRRWLRALLPGWNAEASSSAPTWLSGCRSAGYGCPPMSAVPSSAASRPRMTRIVVDLPAPFGPTKPVTWPARTANDIPSSAWAGPNRLRSPATSIAASMARNLWPYRGLGRHAAERSSPVPSRGTGGPACPPGELRQAARRRGTRRGWQVRTITAMAPDRLARIAAARHAPAIGGALLAVAACGQAAAQAVGLAGHQPAQDVAVLYVLPLCVFALLSTVPLAVLGPAAAAVAVTAGNTASLASFGTATAAGIAGQLIAGYRLGGLDEAR